jgi:type I restriction-modification system DNA methylase subunit
MPKVKRASQGSTDSTAANLGFETKVWAAADALRNNMDAAEYKHVVLGLIFLKYISDAFEEHHAKLQAEKSQGADPEDPDEYRASNIFWVPPEACWTHLKAQAKQATIGQLVDDAMEGIERDNPALKGVLPKDYARSALDTRKLGRMVDRTHRELTDDDISRIAGTYHAWRGEKDAGKYPDVPGFCKAAKLEEIRKHGHVLTPGRYVGAEAQEDDGEPFEEKMKRLTTMLSGQFRESAKLEKQIRENLKGLGYEIPR